MPFFFIDPQAISNNEAVITGPEARHINAVLRLGPGKEITLFDGRGSVYRAMIEAVSKNSVRASILSRNLYLSSPPHLHLAIGLLKGKKIDLIIQKATEMGVECILPFYSRFCDLKDISDSRTERWHKIAFEACKQCGRPMPLSIEEPVDLSVIIKNSDRFDHKLLLWENETRLSLGDVLPRPQTCTNLLLAVGPEGGFHPDEINIAKEAGFTVASLGPRTLRAETASLAATAILQFHLGNFTVS